MRRLFSERIAIFLLGFLFIFSSCFVAVVSAADRLPYFKAFGSDVFTGGWFNTGSSCPNSASSDYQDAFYSNPPAYPASPEGVYGGIQTFAKESSGNSAGGASSQYGAFALGLVETPAAPKGFYSAGSLAPTDKNLLTFANSDPSASWGGRFQGGVRQTHCIPDYYSKLPASAINGIPAGGFSGTTSGSGIYKDTNSTSNPIDLVNTGGPGLTIRAGDSLTVFVNGNVYIGKNIIYALDKSDNIPKFALVVRGSIYIDPAVTQLDGFYIAQPLPQCSSGIPPSLTTCASNPVSDDTGVIWTCHDDNTAAPNNSYPNSCTNRLLVNGSIVAKQINLLRTKGDVIGANTGEDPLSAAMSSLNVAELINFTPAMVIGGPFFGTPSAAGGYNIKSLISLPPIF